MVFKLVFVIGLGWAVMVGAQRYWLTTIVERVNDPANRVELPQTTAIPSIDPEQTRRLMQPVTLNTNFSRR